MKDLNILMVDDDPSTIEQIKSPLEALGHTITTCNSAKEALSFLNSNAHLVDIALVDEVMPEMNGREFGKIVGPKYPIVLIMLTAWVNVTEYAVEALRDCNFSDFVGKSDFEFEEKINEVLYRAEKLVEANRQIKKERKEKEKYKRELDSLPKSRWPYIKGESFAMRMVYSEINKVKGTLARVLITGETGTGKELIAKAIYEDSPRNDPLLGFYRIDCSRLKGDTLISEMFGHKKDSFTGAMKDRAGLFETASNGTIFLDEIGNLDLEAQKLLLRVLESGEFSRIGELHIIRKTNARIICATNEDIKIKIENNEFRLDLYYRLSMFEINLPPLRDRLDDINELSDYIINDNKLKNELGIFTSVSIILSINVIKKLKKYNYPGNIRDLENILGRAILNAKELIYDNQIFIDIEHVILPDEGPGTNKLSKEILNEVMEYCVVLENSAKSLFDINNKIPSKLEICEMAGIKNHQSINDYFNAKNGIRKKAFEKLIKEERGFCEIIQKIRPFNSFLE